MARTGWVVPSGDTSAGPRSLDASPFAPTWADRRTPPISLAELGLDPFARVLATTDGTVTELLEAWAGEPVAIGELAQRREELLTPVVDLDVAAGVTVLKRRVVLCGERTRRPLLYAESLIALDRVPLFIADGLLIRRTPIGRILRESRLETYRELLQLGVETCGALASSLALEPHDIVVSRTYRIIAGSQPIMLINEKFPGRLSSSLGA